MSSTVNSIHTPGSKPAASPHHTAPAEMRASMTEAVRSRNQPTARQATLRMNGTSAMSAIVPMASPW